MEGSIGRESRKGMEKRLCRHRLRKTTEEMMDTLGGGRLRRVHGGGRERSRALEEKQPQQVHKETHYFVQ